MRVRICLNAADRAGHSSLQHLSLQPRVLLLATEIGVHDLQDPDRQQRLQTVGSLSYNRLVIDELPCEGEADHHCSACTQQPEQCRQAVRALDTQ